MDCVSKSFSIVLLKIFFIFAVNSTSSENNSAKLVYRPNNGNSFELLVGPNEKGSVEQPQGPNDDSGDILDGTNKGELGESGESVSRPNGNSTDVVKITEYPGKNKNQYVEFDILKNETVIAKLIEGIASEINNKQENQELQLTEDDKATQKKRKKEKSVHLVDHSYLDIDKNYQWSENSESSDIDQEEKRYLEEINQGNKAESIGSNPHYYQPDLYPGLSRRFAPNYPDKDEELNFDREDARQTNLEPMLASPDFVLALAKESAMLDAATPKNPAEHLIEKDTLRSGNYWNAIWKEDVNPKVLRSNSRKPLGVIPAKINPGSNLYDLVTKLKQISPRLLYVINKKTKY